MMRKYIELLIQAGFVVKLGSHYHTTWLGTQFLRRFEEPQAVINISQKPSLAVKIQTIQ